MSRGSRSAPGGFSLIELLQALVIFSVVIAVIFGLFIQVKRHLERRERGRRLDEQTYSVLSAVRSKIESSAGWLWGDSLGLAVVDRAGDTTVIRWLAKDSSLALGADTVPKRPVRLVKASFRYLDKPLSLGGSGEENIDPDLDGDGMIEGPELKGARLVEINLKTSFLDRKDGITATVRLPEPLTQGPGP